MVHLHDKKHCHWSFARRYIYIIFIYTLLRLRTSVIYRYNTARKQTITLHSDDQTLLVNTPAQTESLLRSLEEVVGGQCLLLLVGSNVVCIISVEKFTDKCFEGPRFSIKTSNVEGSASSSESCKDTGMTVPESLWQSYSKVNGVLCRGRDFTLFNSVDDGYCLREWLV